MRLDPSMNNRGEQFDSPHISVPIMKGDLTNIDPLDVSPSRTSNNNAIANNGANESRGELGSSPSSASNTPSMGQQLVMGGSSTELSPTAYQFYPEVTTTTNHVASHEDLPQARQIDSIFRESQNVDPTFTSTFWSNVVSSAIDPNSPIQMSTTSLETLLASNMSHPPAPVDTNFQYMGTARARSQSFGDSNGNEATSSPQLLKSFSFGNPADHQQSSNLGIPPSHPGHSSYKDSTLPTFNQGVLNSPMMMYPSTPYQEFKPHRSSMGSYSPISLGGDSSMATDQTSPMSSPSLSPHVSPGMHPRKHPHGEGPPMWQLSDEFHSEPHPRLHQLPQSIPEHHLQEQFAHHHQSPYMRPHGPTSPQRHSHSPSSSGSHHNSMYSTRRQVGGPRSHSSPSSAQVPMHHRSSTEVLKTLLRKKACLYEPETSFAVSLVTWLVGRQLALSQGYFTRQQLQAGVHSCVSGKIDEGHVTRTKVNRCMQVILNSCFHYIIPRPDGSEECGKAFKVVFAREAADEDHLLGTLPPPWNDLTPQAPVEDGSPSSLFHDLEDVADHHQPHSDKRQGKESSSASQASDSLDSGSKRSVLLCFNENIRSAADVFRCHNEFIRDVAHTGNLSLSPEDWQAFFSGTRSYRKRSASLDGYPQSRHSHLAEMHDRMDQEGLSKLRTSWCAKRYDHDHAFCAFAHVDINRGWLRRDPFAHNYKPIMCPYIKPITGADDCYVNMCPLGVHCHHSHSKEEMIYHPENYKRQPCRSAPGSCPQGDICPNTHQDVSAHHSYGYNRHGKRHDHSHYHRATHPGSTKRRVATSTTGHTGFGKLPDGSPMVYIDPAPLSEFEKTLLLPGLQAIFRDHSSSIFYATMAKNSPYEYGPFGYRSTAQIGTTNTQAKPFGKL